MLYSKVKHTFIANPPLRVDNARMSIHKRIERARRNAGLSPADLAKAAGVSRPAVDQWEGRGTKTTVPNGYNIIKIGDATRTHPKWLAFGTGPMSVDAIKPEPINEAMLAASIASVLETIVDAGLTPDQIAATVIETYRGACEAGEIPESRQTDMVNAALVTVLTGRRGVS